MNLLFLFIVVVEQCNEYSARLSNVFTEFVGEKSVEVTSGIVEICIGGIYQPLCTDPNLDLEFADSLCFSQGYGGKLAARMFTFCV